MDPTSLTRRAQYAVLCASIPLAAVLFWRPGADVFNTLKATVVVLAALLVVILGLVRLASTARVAVPRTRAWWALGAFVAALGLATAASANPLLAVVGRTGRHNGLAVYLACAVLFAAAVRVAREHPPAALAAGLIAAAVPVSAYALAQAAGLDPFVWHTPEGGPAVFSTMGNANFASAWLGIAVPVCLWGALRESWGRALRAGCAALALAAFLGAALSASLQGPLAATAGAAVLVWAWAADRPPRQRVAALAAGAAGVVVAVGVTGLLATSSVWGTWASAVGSVQSRLDKWTAALAIAADRPWRGVGPDGFADWYPAMRLAEAGPMVRTADAAHSVPLDMLAAGGVPLLLSYAALVAVTAAALVVGLRRRRGPDRLLLAGLGGAWVAYQAQSLVSIDVPPLAVAHWVLAGAIVGMGLRPELVERAWRRHAARPMAAAGVVVSLALVPLALAPMRADLWAGVAARSGDDAAEHAYAQARRLAPWEARYAALQGVHMMRSAKPRDALEAFAEAHRREPRSAAYALNLARHAHALGRHAQAEEAYTRAADLAPATPATLVEVARYALDRGRPRSAVVLLERAVDLEDGRSSWWVLLGRARARTGDAAGARAAFEQALRLDPSSPQARAAPDAPSRAAASSRSAARVQRDS